MEQQQHLPPLSDFSKWLDSSTVHCKVISDDGKVHEDEDFVPKGAVRSKFSEEDYAFTSALRNAVLPPQERFHISAKTIADDCARVFCILLKLKQGKLISVFVHDSDLHDDRLPFDSKPPAFPVVYPGFFEEFQAEQRRFSAHAMQNLDNTRLNDERVLPFIKRKTIAEGGCARIDKVYVHEQYDGLYRQTEQGLVLSKNHCYAIKTYEGPSAESYYKREVEAFNRLREHEQNYPSPSIVGYHGSYIHRGTFNVILEFADGGTLEDYFKDEREPKNGQDIIDFWESFFELVKAICRLHEQSLDDRDPHCHSILHGWHQDIKPKNVLLFRKGDSPYKWTFKLADLGLSQFKAESIAKNDVVALDNFGTKTYGPPECYAWSEFNERQRLKIKQKVDMWSFGCVCSEAVVWVINGYSGRDGLDDYRKQRLNDKDKIENFRGGNCFHNATDVRQSVKAMHDRVRGDLRNSDKITGLVLEMVDKLLRGNPHARPNANMLLYDAEVAIKKARDFLRRSNTGSSPPGAAMSTTDQWRPPSVETQYSQEYRPDRSSDASQKSIPDAFFAGDSPKYFQSPTHTILGQDEYDGYIGQESNHPANERAYPTERLSKSRSGAPHSPPQQGQHQSNFVQRSHSERMRQGTGVSFAAEPSQAKSSSRRMPPSFKLSTRVNHPRNEDAEPSMSVAPDNASRHTHGPILQPSAPRNGRRDDPFDQSAQKSFAKDEKMARELHARLNDAITDLDPRSPDPEEGPSHGPKSSRGTLSNKGSDTGNGKLDPTSTRLILREKIPYLSVASAINWRKSRRREILDDAGYRAYLDDRDHLFIIDDSASMQPFWNEAIALLDPLVYMTKDSDPDGVELYFMTDTRKKRSKKSSVLVGCVRQVKPQGTVDARIRLQSVLQTHISKIQASCLSPSGLSWNPLRAKSAKQPRRVRGLNIYIMTTGEWQPRCELDDIIKDLVVKLDQYNLPAAPIGIQLIRFGNDPTGKTRLKRLDDDLNLKSDIVDTEPSNGNVWKMLLGAINSWFDNEQEQ